MDGNDIIRALDPGEYHDIERTEVDGLIVSTVHTPDRGPETAIIDANDPHPVERYADEAEALEGHEKWVERAPELTEITKLGHDGLGVPDTTVTLERRTQ